MLRVVGNADLDGAVGQRPQPFVGPRIPIAAPDQVQVEVRGKLLAARVVKPPFVRHGKSLVG